MRATNELERAKRGRDSASPFAAPRERAVVAQGIREEIIVKDGHGSIEDALDAALEMTFPASDPIALFMQEYDGWNGARPADGGPQELEPRG